MLLQACNPLDYFELTCVNVPADFNDVICQVFSDLEELIERRENRFNRDGCNNIAQIQDVKIRIEYVNLPWPNIGAASEIHATLPGSRSGCSYVVAGTPYSKINGSYVDDDGDMDALIQLDSHIFDEDDNVLCTFYTGAGTPGLTEYDLYTVLMHEMLHVLGFTSRILENGTANGGTYSIWDSYLFKSTPGFGNNNSIQDRVLNSQDNLCTINCWGLNKNINATELRTTGCTSAFDFVFGANATAPLDTRMANSTPPPPPVEITLSHLKRNCRGANPNEEYVMASGLLRGETRRNLTEAEIEILCTLGYKINGCDGCFNVTHRDGSEAVNTSCCNQNYLVYCADLPIYFEDLLCNDFTNDVDAEITDVFEISGNGTLIFDVEDNGTNPRIVIDHNSPGGIYRLGYTRSTCDCKLINSIITIHIVPCITLTCDNPCNNPNIQVLTFDDFPCSIDPSVNFALDQNNWEYIGVPDNSSDISQIDNSTNRYVRMVGGNTHLEGINIRLCEPIGPNCSANITLTAGSSQINPNSPTETTIIVSGSQNPPCPEIDPNLFPITSCGGTFSSILIDSRAWTNLGVPLNFEQGRTCNANPVFEDQTITWVNNNAFPINYIMIRPDGTNNQGVWAILDEVSIRVNNCNDGPSSTIIPQLICQNGTFRLKPEYQGATYLWNFGDPTGAGNISTAYPGVHSFSNTGNYFVTVTVTLPCGIVYTSTINIVIRCFDPLPCLQCPANSNRINLTHPLFRRLSDYNVDITEGSCVSISGRLVFNEDVLFKNCSIYLEPGAEIVLTPDHSFVSDGSTFQGCSQMWRSITVPNSCWITCINNTIIRDANFGLDVLGNATLQLGDCEFNQNRIGIRVTNGVINPSMFLHNNTFQTILNSPFLPNFTGQSVAMTEVGIQLIGSTMQIGTDGVGGSPNYFNNLITGIIADQNSNLFSFNCHFNNLPTTSTTAQEGVAIYGRLSHVTAKRNNINIARVGIFLDRCNTNIINNNFIASIANGIWLNNCFREIKINDNFLSYSLSGIQVFNPSLLTAFEIINNDLIGEASPSSALSGIQINGIRRVGTRFLFINSLVKDNSILHNSNGIGIKLFNCRYVALDNNEFVYGGSTSLNVYYTGVELDESSGCILNNNKVLGNSTLPSSTTAYNILGAAVNSYCNNQSKNVHVGFSFFGTCTSENRFIGNKIEEHYHGLSINNNSVMGIQDWKLNQFIDPFTLAAINTSNELSRSQFKINVCNSPLWPSSISPAQNCVNNPLLWFRNISGGSNAFSCPSYTTKQDGPIPPSVVQIEENDLLTSLNEFSNHQSPLKFEMQLDLFSKLKDNNYLLGTNSSIDNFFYNSINSNYNKFYEVDDLINRYAEFVTNNWNIIYSISNELTPMYDSIKYIDSMILISSGWILESYKQEKNQLINLILVKHHNANDLISNYTNNELGEILALIKSSISNIQPIGIVELNRKNALEIYANTILSKMYELNSSQYAITLDIANQCFLDGGRGVLIARGMLNEIYGMTFDDNSICPPILPIVLNDKDLLIKDYQLIPNPNSGNFKLYFPNSEYAESAEIVISNVYGVEIYSNKFTKLSNYIEFKLGNKNKDGIYFIKISDKNYQRKIIKFLVIQE